MPEKDKPPPQASDKAEAAPQSSEKAALGDPSPANPVSGTARRRKEAVKKQAEKAEPQGAPKVAEDGFTKVIEELTRFHDETLLKEIREIKSQTEVILSKFTQQSQAHTHERASRVSLSHWITRKSPNVPDSMVKRRDGLLASNPKPMDALEDLMTLGKTDGAFSAPQSRRGSKAVAVVDGDDDANLMNHAGKAGDFPSENSVSGRVTARDMVLMSTDESGPRRSSLNEGDGRRRSSKTPYSRLQQFSEDGSLREDTLFGLDRQTSQGHDPLLQGLHESDEGRVRNPRQSTIASTIYLNTLPSEIGDDDADGDGEGEEGAGGWQGYCHMFVKSSIFDQISLLLIMLNLFSMGAQTDYMARNWKEDVPRYFHVMNTIFCVLAVMEILFRLVAEGSRFHHGDNYVVNVCDVFAVTTQVIDEILSHFDQYSSGYMKFLRVVRYARLVRLMRVTRALNFFASLRVLLMSIISSLQSLGWVVCLIGFQTFLCGIPLTQMVTEFKLMAEKSGHEVEPELEFFYGSLWTTMLALYQTLSEGIHWSEVMHPLSEVYSPWMELFFAAYSAFTLFAMMNVVTGVFVESALTAAEETRRNGLLLQMKQLFVDLDEDGSGAIDEEEFEQHMQNPKMQHFLKAIDLVPQDIGQLFTLLDADMSGEIDPDELMAGCSRLQGNAKALDLAVLMFHVEKLIKVWGEHQRRTDVCFSMLLGDDYPYPKPNPFPSEEEENNSNNSNAEKENEENGSNAEKNSNA